MKNIVITGATSFIGVALIKKMLNEGYTIYAIVRENSVNLGNLPKNINLRVVYSDLSNLHKIVTKIDCCDAFFHFGWDGTNHIGRDNSDIQAENIKNSLIAIEVASQLNCKCFVGAGSQAEYGNINESITEKTRCLPQTEYGKAKYEVLRQGGRKCFQLGMKYIHLRIFSIYGPGDHPWTLVSSLIEKLANNENVEVTSCQQKWNFLYIDDAADQIIGLYENQYASKINEPTLFNIASTDTRVLKAFVEEIEYTVGKTGKILYGALPTTTVVSIQPDITKLIETIHLKPNTSFSNGIKKIIMEKKRLTYNDAKVAGDSK